MTISPEFLLCRFTYKALGFFQNLEFYPKPGTGETRTVTFSGRASNIDDKWYLQTGFYSSGAGSCKALTGNTFSTSLVSVYFTAELNGSHFFLTCPSRSHFAHVRLRFRNRLIQNPLAYWLGRLSLEVRKLGFKSLLCLWQKLGNWLNFLTCLCQVSSFGQQGWSYETYRRPGVRIQWDSTGGALERDTLIMVSAPETLVPILLLLFFYSGRTSCVSGTRFTSCIIWCRWINLFLLSSFS